MSSPDTGLISLNKHLINYNTDRHTEQAFVNVDWDCALHNGSEIKVLKENIFQCKRKTYYEVYMNKFITIIYTHKSFLLFI